MDFCFEAFVHHPRGTVYRAYRDALHGVARRVASVARIELVSRTEIAGGVEITNLWRGRGIIPGVARALVSPDMLLLDSWTAWHDAEKSASWLVAPHHFAECVRCAGELRFLDAGAARTRILLSGELSVRLESMGLVPRLMRAYVEERVERFFVAMGEPNHRAVARQFEQHLDRAAYPRVPPGFGRGKATRRAQAAL